MIKSNIRKMESELDNFIYPVEAGWGTGVDCIAICERAMLSQGVQPAIDAAVLIKKIRDDHSPEESVLLPSAELLSEIALASGLVKKEQAEAGDLVAIRYALNGVDREAIGVMRSDRRVWCIVKDRFRPAIGAEVIDAWGVKS